MTMLTETALIGRPTEKVNVKTAQQEWERDLTIYKSMQKKSRKA